MTADDSAEVQMSRLLPEEVRNDWLVLSRRSVMVLVVLAGLPFLFLPLLANGIKIPLSALSFIPLMFMSGSWVYRKFRHRTLIRQMAEIKLRHPEVVVPLTPEELAERRDARRKRSVLNACMCMAVSALAIVRAFDNGDSGPAIETALGLTSAWIGVETGSLARRLELGLTSVLSFCAAGAGAFAALVAALF